MALRASKKNPHPTWLVKKYVPESITIEKKFVDQATQTEKREPKAVLHYLQNAALNNQEPSDDLESTLDENENGYGNSDVPECFCGSPDCPDIPKSPDQPWGLNSGMINSGHSFQPYWDYDSWNRYGFSEQDSLDQSHMYEPVNNQTQYYPNHNHHMLYHQNSDSYPGYYSPNDYYAENFYPSQNEFYQSSNFQYNAYAQPTLPSYPAYGMSGYPRFYGSETRAYNQGALPYNLGNYYTKDGSEVNFGTSQEYAPGSFSTRM